MAANTIKGNNTAGLANAADLTVAQVKALIAYVLASADFANQGTTTTLLHGNAAGNPAFGPIVTGDIAANAVINSLLAQMPASTLKGNNTAGLANAADLTAAQVKTLLAYTLASADFVNQGTTATVLHGNAAGNPSFGAVVTVDIAANAVTNPLLAQMAANTLKGNNTAGLANAADLTVAQVLALLGAPQQTTGVWTPADNSGALLAFTGVSANYTRIGNMIFAYATWTYPVNASGVAASISGLPVAAANAAYAQVPSVADTSASITGGLVLVPVQNTATANFDVGTPFGPATNLQLSGATIAVMLIYPAA
jgi:hypothetical protein